MNSRYEKYIEDYLKLTRNASETKRSYSSDIKQFVKWLETKEYKLETLTTLELSKYQEFFEEKGYVESTINRKLSSLNGFIEYLKDIKICNEELKNIIPIKHIPYRESEFMEREEVDKLIEGIYSRGHNLDTFKERDDLILLIFLSTGMRLSEVKNIDINDIQGNEIRVVGKGNKERFIVIAEDLIKKIKSYYKQRKNDETKLFLNQYGKPLAESGLRKLINKRLDMYEIDKARITPHAFRHTVATMLDEMNVPFGTIQNILGHEKPDMTSRYIHTTNASKVEAMQAISLRLSKEGV